MGKANRNLVSKAKIIFTTFKQTLKIDNKFKAKVINVGMPIRDLKNDKRIISKNIDKIKIKYEKNIFSWRRHRRPLFANANDL